MTRPLCEWCGEYTALIGEKRCILCRQPLEVPKRSRELQRSEAQIAFDEAQTHHRRSTWRRGRGPGSLPGYG